MNIKRNNFLDKPRKYPALYQYGDLEEGMHIIILMASNREGTVVFAQNESRYSVGTYMDNWVPINLIPFDGIITMSND